MEVKDLIKSICEWEIGKNESPSVIKINPKEFHELAKDKDVIKHLTLLEDNHSIICHKFDGIPLIITREVETLEIV